MNMTNNEVLASIARVPVRCAIAASLVGACALPPVALAAETGASESPAVFAQGAVPAASEAAPETDASSREADPAKDPLTGSAQTEEQLRESLKPVYDILSETGDDPAASGERAASVSALSPQDLASRSDVERYQGDTMFTTAVAESKAAYPDGSDTAILVGPGDAWIDALSGSGLAGALGPILFTQLNSLDGDTAAELERLGARNVVILGGTAAVGAEVETQLRAAGKTVTRLGGADCFGTQMAIYNYGKEKDLWSNDQVFIATARGFGDALSLSPVAFANRAPIFLANGVDGFTSEQRSALSKAFSTGALGNVVIGGGTAAISQEDEDYLAGLSRKAGGSVERLAGDDQYSTSSAIAEWAASTQNFGWDALAFSTGKLPYDALAGSVLQGRTQAPLLLVDEYFRSTVKAAAEHRFDVARVRVFGGPAAVSESVVSSIVARFNGQADPYDPASVPTSGVRSFAVGTSFAHMLELEQWANPYFSGDQVRSGFEKSAEARFGEAAFYQHALITGGYSGAVTADQLNSYIERIVQYQESQYHVTSTLRGQGQALIDAAREYGVNEVYLLCHAGLESAWGCSQFAQGTIPGAEGSYNFFGIAAFDDNPNNGGSYAHGQGWTTPERGIKGAAKWISEHYLRNGYPQNTIFKMRWNYNPSTDAVEHQYATSPTWTNGIAVSMAALYKSQGISMENSGLGFETPSFS